MDETGTPAGPATVVHRLERATNEHDLDALVACFAAEYRNETPAHPDRGFTGRDQVRANWSQIFAAIPDLTCDVLSCTVEGDTVWSEWEHRGTRPDGSPHLMRGVIIFGVADGLAAWARFYLEPVQADAGTIDQAVTRQVMPGGRQ
jgi:ketosteroid isomerase-like protein